MNEIKRFVIPKNKMGFFVHPRKIKYSIFYDDTRNTYTVTEAVVYPNGSEEDYNLSEDFNRMSAEEYIDWLTDRLTELCCLDTQDPRSLIITEEDKKWMSFGF